jgi:alpha,alpha-trehalase
MPITQIDQLGELFEEVQLKKVFPDGKTFPDCLPKYPLEEINQKYILEKKSSSFDLKDFIEENFSLPKINTSSFESDTSRTVQQHIEQLWDVLTRKPDNEKSSLINLPHPYIVPGGRFSEIYYWDSYFTMLGLQASHRIEMIQNMVDNFAWLIDLLGYIPNANRSYFQGRSQPPVFSLMVELLSEENGDKVLIKYLPQLLKEYDFWMNGAANTTDTSIASHHVVRMPDGVIMNRYWDENETPRPESFKDDTELAKTVKTDSATLFRNIRAACESGWDFSCRWFKDPSSFATIHTTEIVPVDLNCLLFHHEKTLSKAYRIDNNEKKSFYFDALAEKRRSALQQYCWNESLHFYFDYDLKAQQQRSIYTMAAAFPLFFKIASRDQAQKVAGILEDKFLNPGGFVTTPENTGQQWDSPNGWAPLQWIAIRGLENYGLAALAKDAATRWVSLNKKVYARTGKLMEKYNVVDDNLDAGGGEYPAQDGFGWTNGVLLKLMETYNVDN